MAWLNDKSPTPENKVGKIEFQRNITNPLAAKNIPMKNNGNSHIFLLFINLFIILIFNILIQIIQSSSQMFDGIAFSGDNRFQFFSCLISYFL